MICLDRKWTIPIGFVILEFRMKPAFGRTPGMGPGLMSGVRPGNQARAEADDRDNHERGEGPGIRPGPTE
jgi:hypothetical protein